MVGNYKVGIVILNYNRGKLVAEISRTFATYDSIDEILIVDGNSKDDSAQILRNLNVAKIKCLLLTENLGYARGNNEGLKYLKNELNCDICFVVNPDVFFKNEIIVKLCGYFAKNNKFAILGCAQVDPLSKVKSWQYAKGLYDSFWLQFLSYFNIPRHYYLLKKFYVYDYDITNENVFDVSEVPGSFYGIRMSCFADGEVLDNGTFLYWEERLLTKRVWSLGYRVGYVPCCVYEHRHIQYSTSTNTKSLRLFMHGLDSQRYYQQKYLKFNWLQIKMIDVAEKISVVEQWLLRKIKSY